MIRNFFIVALRNILKKRFYSIINILGLTIGITATLFIIIYLNDELSYDRFHDKIDRMYRVGLHGPLPRWLPPRKMIFLKSRMPYGSGNGKK